jgi:hypothetical protein
MNLSKTQDTYSFKEDLFYVKRFDVPNDTIGKFFANTKPGHIYTGVTLFCNGIKFGSVLIFNDKDSAPFIFDVTLPEDPNAIKYEIISVFDRDFEEELEPEQYMLLHKFKTSSEIQDHLKTNIINQSFCKNIFTFISVAKQISEAKKFEDLPSPPQDDIIINDIAIDNSINEDEEEEYEEFVSYNTVIDHLTNIFNKDQELFLSIIKLIEKSDK